MADKLAELIVEINVKLDGLKKGLDQAEKEVKTSGTTMGATLQKAIPYAAIAAGVATIGMAFKKVLTDAAKYGQEISTAMEMTGLGTDFIQDLKYNADLLGVSFSTLVTAIGNMNTKLADAVAGKDSAIALFEGLGLKISDLLAMNPDERLRAIFEAISKIPDESLRAGAAIKVFGTSGDNLLPLINRVDELKESLHLSVEEIKGLQEGAEAMKEMGAKWELLKAKFAAVIWPSLEPFLDGLREVLGVLGQIIGFMNTMNTFTLGGGIFNLPTVPGIAQLIGGGATAPAPAPVASAPVTGSTPNWYPWYDEYASGGIVTSPTLAMIGESGPEAVVPLNGGGLGEVHNHFHIGNLLGDESALRALARKMTAIQKEDGRRLTYAPDQTEYYHVGSKI